jgi:Rod binding domain-containing protein
MKGIDNTVMMRPELPDMERFSAANKKSPENIAAIKKLSEDFEAIFVEIMLKSMRETVDKSKLTDGGNGEQIFQTMLDSEYAKILASQRSSGIADSIEKHLLGLMVDDTSAASLQKAQGMAQYQKAVEAGTR